MASNVSGFIRFDQKWINFREKKERGGIEGAGVQAYSISSKTLTIMECLSGKEERKGENCQCNLGKKEPMNTKNQLN